MSKQPRKVRESLARLKANGIITPDQQDPRQLWLLVLMEPMNNRQGEVFVTHGANFKKFDKRPGFLVLGHGFDRGAMTQAARSATLAYGEAFQPPLSAFRTNNAKSAPQSTLDVQVDQPVDFQDEIEADLDDNN